MEIWRHVPELGSIIALEVHDCSDAHGSLGGTVQAQGLAVQDIDERGLHVEADAETQVEVEALQGGLDGIRECHG